MLGPWWKNNCALQFSSILLTGMWLLSLHSWIVGSALDKIVLLALRVCMQNVFVFQNLQWIVCEHYGHVKMHFDLGFFLLAFKRFKLELLFGLLC